MTTAPDRSWRTRLPGGFLGMLVLVAAVELTVGLRHGRLPTQLSASYDFAGWAVRREAPSAEILCLGDSLVKCGVAPRVLERRLGRPAYNLAVLAGQPAVTYSVFRQALARGAHPRAVLVDFKSNMLLAPPTERLEHVPGVAGLLTPADCLDLAWTSGDTRYGGWLLTARLLPSFQQREPIRQHVLTALEGRLGVEGETAHGRWQEWQACQAQEGVILMPPNPSVLTKEEFGDEPVILKAPWSCDPLNRVYVKRFLRLAAERDIPVFWLLPPCNPRIQAKLEERGIDAAYEGFVRSWQERFGNVTVIDGRHAGYGAGVFVDSCHLDGEGAAVFTAAVAEVVDGRLHGRAGPRWTALPAYEDR
jgi:hypothetical protein